MMKWNRLLQLTVSAVMIAVGIGAITLALRPADLSTACRLLEENRLWLGVLPGVILVLAGGLVLLLGKPRRQSDRFLSFRNEGGAVNISTDAICDYLEKLSPEFPSIVKMTPSVEPRWRKIDVMVDVCIKAGPQLHEICEVLQKRVRERLESGLGIHDARHIIVRVKDISPEHRQS